MKDDTITCLDHGYVKLIESWGSDARIIEAARMSTDKGFEGWGPRHGPECSARAPSALDNMFTPGPCDCELAGSPGDERLLKYLYTHQHNSPFEFAGAVFEVQAPIFVFREWHRHRTQSYNEMSARYTPLPNLNYIPTVERLIASGGTNRQAQSVGATLTEAAAHAFQQRAKDDYDSAQVRYETALHIGVPKELARIILPVGRYSRMRASANLRNWLQFLTLRCDEHAQFEIRQFADAVATFIGKLFPRTYTLWDSYTLTLVPKEPGL